jgi:hypothetical protein
MVNDDKQLQQSVMEELAWDPSITSAHIGVAARDGVVTLSGHVPSYWDKRSAETAASRVKGVKAEVEEIKIQLSGGNLLADEKIAARAFENLASDALVPKDQIKLAVGQCIWHGVKRGSESPLFSVTNEK